VITINCDMCGKESSLFKTDLEGSILSLCSDCSKYGSVISAIREEKEEPKKHVREIKQEQEEIVLAIVQGYGDIIKKKREDFGIKQEDVAKKINEKVSLIHKLEINQFEPSIELARKIEKFLHVKLVEQQKLGLEPLNTPKGEHFTIGDFIKIKKR